MRQGILIRSMMAEDLAFAADCTAEEGWDTENREVLEGFLLHDPNGCLVAEVDGRAAGFCVATVLGRSGFIGELVVRRWARGAGLGPRLLEAALRYLEYRGVFSVYLDGVKRAVPFYREAGFHVVCRSLRFRGRPGAVTSCGRSRRMQDRDLEAVLSMDAAAFGADRGFFLKRRYRLAPELCRVVYILGRPSGFIMGFPGKGVIAVGPWVAAHASALGPFMLEDLAATGSGLPLRVGILETNEEIVNVVRSLPDFNEEPASWRMARGERDDLGVSPACLAVGSPAKG